MGLFLNKFQVELFGIFVNKTKAVSVFQKTLQKFLCILHYATFWKSLQLILFVVTVALPNAEIKLFWVSQCLRQIMVFMTLFMNTEFVS